MKSKDIEEIAGAICLASAILGMSAIVVTLIVCMTS